MPSDNALDPPPARRASGRAPYQRTAAIVIGAAIAVVVLVVVFNMVFRHPTLQANATPAGFGRGSRASQVQPPPAVSPATVAQGRANLSALQRAANSPSLAARAVQVASVSPPAGPPPRGVGVNPSRSAVGPAAG